MPLFFNVPGTSSSFIPSLLSSCLGLKEASLNDDTKNADFVTATSLCSVANKSNMKSNFKLFHLLINPIVRVPLSYIEMKDPSSIFFDSRLKDLTFDEFMMNSTLFEKDAFIKRLLCRHNDDTRSLTKYNVKRAKNILKNGNVGLFHESLDNSFLQFKKAFHHLDFLSSPIIDKCVENKLKLEIERIDGLYRKHGTEFLGYFNKLKDANRFDLELYAFVASSMWNMSANL